MTSFVTFPLRKLKQACDRFPISPLRVRWSFRAHEVRQNEDSFVVDLAVFLRFGAEVRPGTQPVAPALGHPGQPGPATGFGATDDDVLDPRVRPLGRAVVAALPVGVDRAHEVQVLRHRLPQFLGEAFGGSTGLVDVLADVKTRDQAGGRIEVAATPGITQPPRERHRVRGRGLHRHRLPSIPRPACTEGACGSCDPVEPLRLQARGLESLSIREVASNLDHLAVLEAPHLPETLLDGNPGGATPRAEADGGNHQPARVPKPDRVEADLVHRVAERVEIAAHPVVAPVGVGLGGELGPTTVSKSGCRRARMWSISPLLKAAFTCRTISTFACAMSGCERSGWRVCEVSLAYSSRPSSARASARSQ